MVTGYKLREV